MSNNVKAGLIITVILAVVTAMVLLILYGVGREDLKTEIPLPSDGAAKAYVLEHKLLKEVDEIRVLHPGGPNFKSLQGKDDSGKEKIVFLTGTDKRIQERGSLLTADALTKEVILEKVLKEKNIKEESIAAIFLTPYDYTSDRMIWYVRENDIRGHMLSYDYKTGELLFEVFQDPTAWKL